MGLLFLQSENFLIMDTSSDIEEFILKFRAIGGDRSVVGLKEPDTHPCLIYHREENGVIAQFSDNLCADKFRRQQYPVLYELTHWICVVPINGISSLNNQMISDSTYGYIIGKDKEVVDIDNEKDYQYASMIIEKFEHDKC